MIITDFFEMRYDGINLYKTYSDKNMIIHKVNTTEYYEEAIDIENSGFVYEETDIPIEQDELTIDDYKSALSELGVDVDD